MPVTISVDHPEDNIIDIDPYFLELGSGFVLVKGKGNRISIARPLWVGAAHFVVENGGAIVVDPQCVLGSISVHALAPESQIHIGTLTAFNAVTYITAHEPAKIRIGNNCLFAPECSISSSDVHKIFSCETNERLNPAGDIIIGDRVWFGGRAVIFRNSTVGNDSVVGWGSVVKGHFPSNVVLAGSPARVVKTGIRWEP